jgi:hypothetical protein
MHSATRASGPSICSRAHVAAAMRGGLRVAVRAEEPKVRELVVLPPTVHVFELERDRLPVPAVTVTPLAPGTLHPRLDEAPLQTARVRETTVDQDLLQGDSTDGRRRATAAPALPAEMRGYRHHVVRRASSAAGGADTLNGKDGVEGDDPPKGDPCDDPCRAGRGNAKTSCIPAIT